MTDQPIGILLAVQNAQLNKQIKTLLGNNGYQLRKAANAEKLKALTQANPAPSLVLMDEKWLSAAPTEDAEQSPLIRALRTLQPQTEVILLSDKNHHLKLEALRAGAFRSLSLPLDDDELALAVRHTLHYQQLLAFASQNKTLEKLMGNSLGLLGESKRAEILAGILRSVQEIGYDRARLYLLSEDQQNLIGEAQVGMQGLQFNGVRWPIADDFYMQELMREPRSRVFLSKLGKPVHSEEKLEKEGVNEWACVPLVLRGEVIGHLSADNKYTQRRIYEGDLSPLELFAAQAAIAIDNARLFDLAERRAKKLQGVLELTREINTASKTLGQILRTACRKVVEVLGMDHSGLVLFDDDKQSGQVYAEYPLQARSGGRVQISGIPLEEELIARRVPIPITDVATETRLGAVRELLLRSGIRSCLFVPVILRGDIIGSFSLDAFNQPRTFTEDEIALSCVFAEQIAVAVDNARQFEATQRRAKDLATLHEHNLQLTATARHDCEALLNLIVEQAVKLLKVESGGIYKYNPSLARLELAAAIPADEHLTGICLQVGEGMAGQLIRQDLPYLSVANYREWPGCAEVFRENCPFEAVLAVPLCWNDQVTGVLYLNDKLGREYSEESIRLLKLFAQTAAGALANQKLIASDLTKLRRLELLSRHLTTMFGNSETMPLNERLMLIARQTTEILDAECCGIFRVNRPGSLRLEAGHGYRAGAFKPGHELPIRSGVGMGLMGHIAAQGGLFRLHGKALTTHFAVANAGENHTPSGACHSLLALPLKKVTPQGEQLVGLLSVDNKLDPSGQPQPTLGFDQEDESFIRILGEAIGIAFEVADWADRLKQDHQQTHSILDSLPLAAIAVDPQGKIIQFNKHAERMLNCKESEVLGTDVGPLYDDQREPRRIGKLLRQSPDGKLSGHKTYVRNKNGRAIPIRLTASWLYNEFGNCIGSVGYFEDIEGFELIQRAGEAVAKAKSLSAGLQSLAAMLIEQFPSAFCRVLLLHEDGTNLRVEAARLGANLSIEWQPGYGELIPLDAYKGLKEFLKAGIAADLKPDNPRAQPGLEQLRQQLALPEPIRRLQLIPLTVDQRILGMIDLGEFLAAEQSQFTPENIQLAASLATHSVMLVDKMQQHEFTRRHEALLTALLKASEHILTAKAPQALLPEIVRLAVQLLGFDCGGLYLYRSHIGQFEAQAEFQLHQTPLPPTLSDRQGVIGLAARTGQLEVIQDYASWPEQETWLAPLALKTVIAIPIKRPSGQVEAVLFVASQTKRAVSETDRDVLMRFAAQAALGLQASRASTLERRTHNQLETLHQIGNYLLEVNDQEKLLHAVLTGITARYGLRMNRAVLLLQDGSGKYLRGVCGIGQRSFGEAQVAWEQDEALHLSDFASYREHIQRGGLPVTPIHELISGFSLPLAPAADDCFNRASRDPNYFCLTPADFHQLPPDFKQLWEPETTIAIAPLIVRKQVIGFIAADNKFTRGPITREDLNLLAAFASAAALALDHTRLLTQTGAVNQQLLALYALSQELHTKADVRQLPEMIVRQLWQVAGASTATLLLIDESTGKVESPVIVPGSRSFHPEWIRPDGMSMQIMRTGKEVVVPDVEAVRTQVNQHVDPSARAALGLPLALPNKKLGVIWLHYDQPRQFDELEISALKLFVNHAALAFDHARSLDRMEQLRAATDALASFINSRGVEQHLAQQACAAMRADAAILWLYDEERGNFSSERSTDVGINPEKMEAYRLVLPSHQGTAWTIMREGVVEVADASIPFQSAELGVLTRQIMREQAARGFRGLALQVGKEQLGVLYLLYRQPLSLSEEEKKIALTFANHAALRLKTARLFEHLQRIKKAAEQAARASLEGERNSTLRSIVIRIKEAVDCDAVSLFEYNSQTAKLVDPPIMAGVRNEAAVFNAKERDEYPMVYRMLNESKPYEVKRVAADPEFRNNRFTREEGVQSLVIFPLQVKEQKVGVLFVNYRRLHEWSQEELETLQLFANTAAAALYKQQLSESLARELEIKQELEKMMEAMLTVVSRREVLDLAARHTAGVMGAVCCHLVLPDQTGQLCLSAAAGWFENQVGKLFFPPGRGSLTGYTIELQQPVIVEDLQQGQDFAVLDFVRQSRFRSILSAPIQRDGKFVGAVLVLAEEPGRFGRAEADLLKLLAHQIAVALRSAERFEAVERQRRQMTAVSVAAQAISASFGLEQNPILDQIVNQTVESLTSSTDLKPTAVTLIRYDEARDELRLESAWPPKRTLGFKAVAGEVRHLKRMEANGQRIGVVGRAVLLGRPHLVSEVRSNSDYLSIDPATQSELAVPLYENGRVIGVLNVESSEPFGLSEEDAKAVQALAKHAEIALRNARQHKELKQARLIAKAQITLALIGSASSSWGHNAVAKAETIKGTVALLESDLSQGKTAAELLTRLTYIRDIAIKLQQDIPSFPRVGERLTDAISIYDIVCEQVRNSWADGEYESKGFQYVIEPPPDIEVNVIGSGLLIGRVLGILIDNALKAMKDADTRLLTISFLEREGQLEVAMKDTGRGIPPHILKLLLREPIPKAEGELGSGSGLLVALNIVQLFGGDLYCVSPGPDNTTLAFTLPLVEEAAQGDVAA